MISDKQRALLEIKTLSSIMGENYTEQQVREILFGLTQNKIFNVDWPRLVKDEVAERKRRGLE